ncbi:DUF2927 domain-containing protein [Roseobacter ponti]|nr:DUF2927 domain-containing protein [Roseobacter ponti]
MMRRLVLPLVILLAGCAPATQNNTASRAVFGEGILPPMKTFAPQKQAQTTKSNTGLARDFMELSFRMESGRALPVFTRFEGPVTVRMTGNPPATMKGDLNQLITRLQTEAQIPISVTTSADANITIQAVPRSSIKKVLPQAACFVAPNVGSIREYRSARRAPQTNWTLLQTRERLAIFIPNDSSPQEVRDCLHEELGQALGPLNDLYRLPDSVFNDDNVHTVLTGFDMMILRATYAPELRSGMSPQEVATRLPAIFDRINPAGRKQAAAPASPTPQVWNQSIQTALGPGADYARRQVASDTALRIAVNEGWTDNRRAFAHYARARLLQASDSEAARRQYEIADRFYARSPQTRLHRAYVATQLAAYELADGDPVAARSLVEPHISIAAQSQNASLLATLQLLRAESFAMEGRADEARAVRLDSLGWARYGFGADWVVRAKLREISALNRQNAPA